MENKISNLIHFKLRNNPLICHASPCINIESLPYYHGHNPIANYYHGFQGTCLSQLCISQARRSNFHRAHSPPLFLWHRKEKIHHLLGSKKTWLQTEVVNLLLYRDSMHPPSLQKTHGLDWGCSGEVAKSCIKQRWIAHAHPKLAKRCVS